MIIQRRRIGDLEAVLEVLPDVIDRAVASQAIVHDQSSIVDAGAGMSGSSR